MMQAQVLRQQTAISPQQSLSVIKTLLSASFGCIAYLRYPAEALSCRNLLPDENFGEGRLTSGERGSMAYGSQDPLTEKNSRQISGVRVKTVTRGFSTEADKLLNYLEHGIFDAIERQYLKSFIFAIYLDNDDPNNIVESYTYTFTYYTVPGTVTTVPIMSLDDQLNKLSLNALSKSKDSDAVAQATFKGRAPTLGDVKQSVKTLIKNLILATQSLEPLPKRRFATFKLFYRENTPADYEPPYFRPGDPVKDKFVFTTHDKSETPEKFSVGAVVTPHHGIDVQVKSVARYVPNGENDASQYLGIEKIEKKGSGMTRGSKNAEAMSTQLDVQRRDAEGRKVAWSAEDPRWTDEDAEGEDDPEFLNDSGIGFKEPLGLRQADGTIRALNPPEEDAMDTSDADKQFFGRPDVPPSRVGQLRTKRAAQEDLKPTQQLEATQDSPSRPDDAGCTMPLQSAVEDGSRTIDTQMLKAVFDQSAMDWTINDEMLDMETQPGNVTEAKANNDKKVAKTTLSRTSTSTGKLSCACEHEDEDDVVLCEACEKWLHIRCMGYHSPEDPRLPDKYVCIPCRLQGDVKFDLIKDKYPDILGAYEDLVLFRRSIKISEKHNPENLKQFRSLTKCTASLADLLWKRLEREGFIALELIETDKLGLLETRSRAPRAAKKQVGGAKHKHKYVFVAASKKTTLYRDYFSPDSEAEKQMLGLGRKATAKKTKSGERKGDGDDMSPAIRNAHLRVTAQGNPDSLEDTPAIELNMESQTQEDTQMVLTPKAVELKRRTGSPTTEEMVRTNKKVKISIVEENVDIEE